MFRVDCDLGLRAKRNLVVTHFVADINLREGATSRRPRLGVDKLYLIFQLSLCNRIDYRAHFGLEYTTRDGVEGNLSRVTCVDPLQGILLERSRQITIPTSGIDE